MKPRQDDYTDRRKHLKDMSDQALKAYFFELTDRIIDPILVTAKDYTTPAIERSILLRMGFSSIEAKAITEKLHEQNLLPFGAGHVVYQYHLKSKLSIREAGLKLLEDDVLMSMTEVFKHETE